MKEGPNIQWRKNQNYATTSQGKKNFFYKNSFLFSSQEDISSDPQAAKIALAFAFLLLTAAVVPSAPFRREKTADRRTDKTNLLMLSSFTSNNTTISTRNIESLKLPSTDPSLICCQLSPQPSNNLKNNNFFSKHTNLPPLNNTCPVLPKQPKASYDAIDMTIGNTGLKFILDSIIKRKITENTELKKAYLSQKRLLQKAIEEIQEGKTSIDPKLFKALIKKGLNFKVVLPSYFQGATAFVDFTEPLTINWLVDIHDRQKENLSGIRFAVHNELHHVLVFIANKACNKESMSDRLWLCIPPLLGKEDLISPELFDELEDIFHSIDTRIDLLYFIYLDEKINQLFQEFSVHEKKLLLKILKNTKENGHSNNNNPLDFLSLDEQSALKGFFVQKRKQIDTIFLYKDLLYTYLDSQKEISQVIRDTSLIKIKNRIELIYQPLTNLITDAINSRNFDQAILEYEAKTGKKLNIHEASPQNPVPIPQDIIYTALGKPKPSISLSLPLYYITHIKNKGSNLILHGNLGEGLEGFLGDFFKSRNQYLEGGLYYKLFEEQFVLLPDGSSAQQEERKNTIFKIKTMIERSSDMQSFLYDPELMKLLAPTWKKYFDKYFEYHAENFSLEDNKIFAMKGMT